MVTVHLPNRDALSKVAGNDQRTIKFFEELAAAANAGGGGAVAWGGITGTIAAQTDLAALFTAVDADIAVVAGDLAATDADVVALTAALAATDATVATKQATLVSATNIKTVNGNTLLGSGDLAISVSILAGVAVLSVPINAIEASATVTAAVTPASRIVLSLGTMVDADENAAEMLDVAAMAAIPGTGAFVIHMAFSTPTRGDVPVNWSVI